MALVTVADASANLPFAREAVLEASNRRCWGAGQRAWLAFDLGKHVELSGVDMRLRLGCKSSTPSGYVAVQLGNSSSGPWKEVGRKMLEDLHKDLWQSVELLPMSDSDC